MEVSFNFIIPTEKVEKIEALDNFKGANMEEFLSHNCTVFPTEENLPKLLAITHKEMV